MTLMKKLNRAICLAAIAISFSQTNLWAEDAPAVAFPKGTLSLQAYGTYAAGLDNTGSQLASGAVGASYYVFDNLSLGVEASGYSTLQDSESGVAFGLAGVLRDHLLHFDRFTLFSDVSFGPAQDSTRIPADGTYFNFITRTGVGLTYELREHLYLMGGVRYFHLSNAKIEGADRNPSINGIEGFFGLMWTM